MYDIWIDYSVLLKDLLMNRFSYPVYESAATYDQDFDATRTQGLLVWNFSVTMLKDKSIDPENRCDFIIRPLEGETVPSGWGGYVRYGINIDVHRDIDQTHTRLRYMLKEIAALHNEDGQNGVYPRSVGNDSAKYQPILQRVAGPIHLTTQPYSRGILYYHLHYVGCSYPDLTPSIFDGG